MRTAVALFLALGLVTACDPTLDDGPEADDGDIVTGDDPGDQGWDEVEDGERGRLLLPDNRVQWTFAPEQVDIVNPERGIYVGGSLTNGFDFTSVRSKKSSVAYVVVRLDEWRTRSTLSADLLAKLRTGFADARAAGVKILLRFVYNFDSSGADATRAVTIGHINQLAPVLRDNADVIAAVEAGFIGAWGEWHSSSNRLSTPADRKAIVEALLAALPSSRDVMLRTPMYKQESWGTLSAARAFDGSSVARIGHHNDCFLASDSDLGTYAAPVDSWRSYVASDARYLPVAGEVCRVNRPRTDCGAALKEMKALRYSLLSHGGSSDVWNRWAADGCADNVFRHLGYRFLFDSAIANQSVAPGGVLTLDLEIRNTGFAAPYNKRPAFVVLTRGDRRFAARIATDPRRWTAGAVTSVRALARLPRDLAPGDYDVSLWLPDDASRLRTKPAFSIRFASAGVWDKTWGMNKVGTIKVDPAAPATDDPNAVALVEL